MLALRGEKMDPLNPATRFLQANALFWQGSNADAVKTWRTLSDKLGVNFIMNSYLAVALINLGQTNEAGNLIASGLRADPNDTGGLFASVRAILLAKQGDESGSSSAIEQALGKKEGFGHAHHVLYNIASAYALLKKPEQALKYLREAAADGFPCYPLFQADANLDNLRNDAGFKAFLAEQRATHEQIKSKFAKVPSS